MIGALKVWGGKDVSRRGAEGRESGEARATAKRTWPSTKCQKS